MCGICGVFNYGSKESVDKDLLHKMCNVMIHRGPDEEGYYVKGDIGLGIRRLAIIDLKTGHQPIHNEDKSIWVIDNGEIYNFQELRENLEKKGHRFYTKTDTEAIVHLYEDYGIDCVKYLRGMFAFALWDETKKKLFLVRDRLGKKPLNYMIKNRGLVFGSEIKCILENPEIKKEVNLEALHYYLTYQYIPSPLTMFEGIEKLPPASILSCDEKGNINIRRYWNLNYRNKLNLEEEEYIEQIRSKLKEATKLRMISDVPVGAFLSGGLDSSVIVGLMSEISSEPVKTFSIGFEEQDFSELHYARIVAKHFGTNHTEFIVKSQMVEILPKLIWHYGEPYADSSALPSYYVANETRKHVTVALNGDGGDENFAGYLRYRAHKIAYFVANIYKYSGGKIVNRILDLFPESSNQRNLLRKAKRFSSALFEPPEYRNIRWHCFFNNEQKMKLYSKNMRTKFLQHNAYIIWLNCF
ncbi:MAG: asparagine synthase (glutamine-hydrolyzing) [bacterium]